MFFSFISQKDLIFVYLRFMLLLVIYRLAVSYLTSQIGDQ